MKKTPITPSFWFRTPLSGSRLAGTVVITAALLGNSGRLLAQEEGGDRERDQVAEKEGEGLRDGENREQDRPERSRPERERPERERPERGRPEGERADRERPSGDRPNPERPNPERAGQRPGGPNRFGGDRMMNPGMFPGGFPMAPLMVALDTDKDGSLSSAEIENASKALLTLDKDGDGKLSLEELRPPMPEGFRPGRGGSGPGPGGPGPGGFGGGMVNEEMMQRMFAQRDADGDGKLSGDEIPPPMRERLTMVDTNGNGSIEKEEMQAAAQRMRERMGRPGAEGRMPQNRRDGEAVRPRRPQADAPAEGNKDD